MAKHRIVSIDHMRTIVLSPPELRKRICENRCASDIGKSGKAFRQISIVLRSAYEQGTLCRAEQLDDPFTIRDIQSARRVCDTNPGFIRSSATIACNRQSRFRNERLAQWKVQVHWTARNRSRQRNSATSERSRVANQVRRIAGERYLDEPLHLSAIEMILVDRLGRTDVAQLGRTISRQYNKRNAGTLRFDYSRIEIRRRRSRRAKYRDGRIQRACNPKSKERR
jgi:hypothetical protein